MKPFCSTIMIAVFLLFCINGIQAQIKTQAEKLMDALNAEDLNNALILVQNVDDVNYCDKQTNGSLLMWAAWHGNTEVLKVLLAKGAEVDYQGRFGTALTNATMNGHTEAVEALLDSGAKVDLQIGNGLTALHYASLRGHVEIVKLLVDKGAEVDMQVTKGEVQRAIGKTSLMFASEKGHNEVVKLLLDKGANPNIKDAEGKTAKDYEKNYSVDNATVNKTNDDKGFLISTSYGIDANGASLVMKNGQWVPEEGAIVTGQIDIIVQLDGEENHFPTNITGTKMVNDKLTYLCENGESFYLLNGQIPQVVVDSEFETGVENLDVLYDEYRKNKSENLVWKIWKIQSLR